MKPKSQLSPKDLDRLSAYVDGELVGRQKERLESRLRREPALRRALAELQRTVELLRSLPDMPPPRRFTLTPEMVAPARPRRAYPVLRLATALAALAFMTVVGVDALTRGISLGAMAPAAPQPAALDAARLEAEKAEEGIVSEAPPAEAEVEYAELAPTAAEELEVLGAMEAPGATPCAECPAAEAQARAGVTPATPFPTVAPRATSTQEGLALAPPEAEGEVGLTEVERPPPGPGGVSPLRSVEIGLGAAVVVLTILTLWARRTRAG